MQTPPRLPTFWWTWLLVLQALVAVSGLLLVLLPDSARQAFSLLVYGSAEQIDRYGPEAVRYISLVHAVLGAVLAGWAATMAGLIWHVHRIHPQLVRRVLAVSLGIWFVPDTMYSLLSGYWPNAVLNVLFLVMYGIGVWCVQRGELLGQMPVENLHERIPDGATMQPSSLALSAGEVSCNNHALQLPGKRARNSRRSTSTA